MPELQCTYNDYIARARRTNVILILNAFFYIPRDSLWKRKDGGMSAQQRCGVRSTSQNSCEECAGTTFLWSWLWCSEDNARRARSWWCAYSFSLVSFPLNVKEDPQESVFNLPLKEIMIKKTMRRTDENKQHTWAVDSHGPRG